MVCTAVLSKENQPCLHMGEKPTGRILLATGLLFVSLITGMASADQSGVSMEVEIHSFEEQPWYDPEHPLVMTPSLHNAGDSLTFDINPSCMFVLNVYNSTGFQLVDGSEACPDRVRGEDLASGQTMTYPSLEWDMKDSDGHWLEGGTYTVEVMHMTLGLSHSETVVVQTPVNVPENLVYDIKLVQRDVESPMAVASVSVANPTDELIRLDTLPTCSIEVRTAEHARLGSSCFGQATFLMPSEVLLIEQFPINMQQTDTVQVSIPGENFERTLEFNLGDAPVQQVEAVLDLRMLNKVEPLYGFGDVLAYEAVLSSTTATDQSLMFSSSCKAEMWVVNDLGNIVYDSRSETTCTSIELELVLEPTAPLTFTLPQWMFYDQNACHAESGFYKLMVELPEHGLFASHSFQYSHSERDECLDNDILTFTAEQRWLTEHTLQLHPTVTATETLTHLRMNQPCSFELSFINELGEQITQFPMLCDLYDSKKLHFSQDSTTIAFPPIDIVMRSGENDLLPQGSYTLDIHLLSSTPALASLDIEWPQNSVQKTDSLPEDEPLIQSVELTGTWVPIPTEDGTCFALNTDTATYLLSNAKTLSAWTPNDDVEGIYLAHFSDSSPACSKFSSPSVEVVEVLMERPVAVESEQAPATAMEDAPTEPQTATVATTAVTVVVTASILSLITIAAVTNEGLRLPATMAGLWFLGLLGKTHETTDGRYQRGRLMGYLTANPGCHFRALMSALDMSNGQITHHLRILESEEHVWRKNDGRLVRYYPLTNQLNPTTHPDDLPVPPLSPDPNSLQGKILSLLDEDGDMGQFPTQAELAKRLEKSQQLISHHLRTLQKYGLVERRKMGVKNRYKLTREAVFLLETSDDFVSR